MQRGAERLSAAVHPALNTEVFPVRTHVADPVRRARAYLLRVAEPPAPALAVLVAQQGPVIAAARVRDGDVPREVAVETDARCHIDDGVVDGDFAQAAVVGARLVIPEDEDWPVQCLRLHALQDDRGVATVAVAVAPIALWVRGERSLAALLSSAASVVGARAATGYGELVAGEIGYALGGAGMTVVSGAAYGIDGAAHRGALKSGGATVAVLGCGIDIPYPAGHSSLLDGIAASGLVVSEYPPGTNPARHRFLVRNRLIAALSSATVVVEAGARSGARNTATTAAALGKTVLAVPGPITSAMSVGCHDLVRTGAAMIAGSVGEILEAVGPVGEHLCPPGRSTRRSTDGLAGAALRVHEALRREESRDAQDVAVDSGVPIERVRALLTELELTGHAVRHDDGWQQAKGDEHDH
jgi:DNA processing protein